MCEYKKITNEEKEEEAWTAMDRQLEQNARKIDEAFFKWRHREEQDDGCQFLHMSQQDLELAQVEKEMFNGPKNDLSSKFRPDQFRGMVLGNDFPLILPGVETSFCASISTSILIIKNQTGEAFVIDSEIAYALVTCLQRYGSVALKTYKEIIVASDIQWHSSMNLTLVSERNIALASGSNITSDSGGELVLRAGLVLGPCFPLILPGVEVAFCANISTSVLIVTNQSEGALVIDWAMANMIVKCLQNYGAVVLKASKEIIISSKIEWHSSMTLTLISKSNIVFASGASIVSYSSGSLVLKAGIGDCRGTATVKFIGYHQISMYGGGEVTIHYNPQSRSHIDHPPHKYYNPLEAFRHIYYGSSVESFMLINNLADLQNIMAFPSGNYALSNNIHAKKNGHYSAFVPLCVASKEKSFYGNFDGNGYTISGLNISDENNTGLFRNVVGDVSHHSKIKHLTIADSFVKGSWRVGALAGNAIYTDFEDITLRRVAVEGDGVVGGFIGSLAYSSAAGLNVLNAVPTEIEAIKCIGPFVGAVIESFVDNQSMTAGCIFYETETL